MLFGSHGDTLHLRLHARRHGRRRRRAHAPAGRASHLFRAIPGLVTLRPGDANDLIPKSSIASKAELLSRVR
jgi:hypothetical protein